jgi:hypothetical protein
VLIHSVKFIGIIIYPLDAQYGMYLENLKFEIFVPLKIENYWIRTASMKLTFRFSLKKISCCLGLLHFDHGNCRINASFTFFFSFLIFINFIIFMT